ncbi:hypothetical protein RND81_11G161000 [Saponaria officinalis]|uniref:BHLH domain-containing protein n=1 Tax=Saponaria officinalis TaxID=3572 RepID=A0AAW1HMV1_SAPOF
MTQQNHESEPFSWENLCNEAFDNSGDEKVVSTPETGEEKGKKRSREDGKKAKEKGENVVGKEGETFEHETHIWTERERRKKMRNMFTNLHSLLPQLPPKADKSTIVDEAISYIKTLQTTLQRLQKQKLKTLQGCPSNTLTLDHHPSVAATSRLAMLSTRETFMANQVSSMNTSRNKNNNDNNNSNNSNSNSNSSSSRNTSFSASASHLPVIIQTWTSTNVVLNICGNDANFAVYVSKKNGLLTTLCCVLEKHRLEVVSAHISSDVDRCIYIIQAQVAKGACDQFPELMNVEEICKQAAAEMMLWISS